MKNFLTIAFIVLLAFTTLPGCYQPDELEIDRLIIKGGRHRSTPYDLSWNNDRLKVYEWHGHESQSYDLGDNDQCDWNKLTGWSFTPLRNHEDAVMIGWRYDLSGYRYFAPYYHENGNTWWAEAPCTTYPTGFAVDLSLPVLKVENFSDVVETHLILNREERYTAVFIINKTTGQQIFWEKHWTRDLGRVREIYPWFGGNREAPHDIIFYRRLMSVE